MKVEYKPVFSKIIKSSPVIIGCLILAGCNSTETANTLDITAQQNASATPAIIQGKCPRVSLRDGTAFYRAYTRGGDGDPAKITYQASLSDVTRSCTTSGEELVVNVVAAGRLVAGPQGSAGNVNLPIRVAVVDKLTRNVLYSELTQTPVVLSGTNLTAQFVFADPNVRIPAGAGGETEVFVGFDTGPTR